MRAPRPALANGANRIFLVTALFYVRDATGPVPEASALPDGYGLEIWRPGRDGLGSGWCERPTNLVWWAMERGRLFARGGFAEVTIRRNGRLVHRLIATRGWYRFPFMERDDLQFGGLWTCLPERRRGLARIAMAEVHRRIGSEATRFWYVTNADNAASIGLIESCGYRLFGKGRRTRPLGIAMLGQYVPNTSG